MSSMIEDLRKRICRQHFAPAILEHINENNDSHEKIIEAIIRKDSDKATELIRLHLEKAKKVRLVPQFPNEIICDVSIIGTAITDSPNIWTQVQLAQK